MTRAVTWLILAVLVLGMAYAVFMRAGTYCARVGPDRWHGYDGTTERPLWQARVASLWLAKVTGAKRCPQAWIAGWFFLSCIVWLAALRDRALVPLLVMGLGTVAAYSTTLTVGTVVSDGPLMFFFSLAAVTATRNPLWWAAIGLAAIPFKATGALLVVVAFFLVYSWRQALAVAVLAVAALLAVHWASGGVPLLESAHPTLGVPRWLLNFHAGPDPHLVFVMAGLVLAGALAARGRVLAVYALLAGMVLCFAAPWEPRLWCEALPLAGIALHRMFVT